jgi:prevent-host-death family protein
MPPRIKLSEDIQPLTTFRNNSAEMLRQMKKNKRAFILTVNGKPAAVVQSVEEYERLNDLAGDVELREAIAACEEDIRYKRTVPAEEFFEQIDREMKRAG